VPKATLVFNLPEEQSEYTQANRAGDMSAAIYEFSNILRAKAKYQEKRLQSWDEVKDMWWNVLNDYNLDPYSE
jgi:hypothetical protein